MTRKPKTEEQALRAKADRLAGRLCRMRGKCEAEGELLGCGRVYRCSDRLEWCHILSRGIRTIRHDPENAICLCNIHHRYYTQNPAEFVEFVERKRPGTFESLREKTRRLSGNKRLVDIYKEWIEWTEQRITHLLQSQSQGQGRALED